MTSTPSRPSILGIWRLGTPLHVSRTTELALAQPADAARSPRWDYVIKRPVSDGDGESLQQISRFAAAAASVCHPNLIAVLDASSSATMPYVVMPRLEGFSMQWHLDQTSKPLPVALWLVRQTAQALDALHSAGWVHGDVKPENCMVGPRGHLTLVDLGFATRTHTIAAGCYRGTPEFSAPESLMENIAAMPPMDVFSLGRILDRWLKKTEPTGSRLLEPINDLCAAMTAASSGQRPTADAVAKQLLRLEIETLGHHIGPATAPRAA